MQDEFFTELDLCMERIFGNDGIVFTEDSLPVHTVYVSRLHPNVNMASEQHLRNYFSKYGAIDNIVVCHKYATYAFITFHKPEDATQVLRSKHYILRRRIRVDIADSWHQPKSIQKPKNVEASECGSTSNLEELSEEKQSIFILNNDCWLHIFSYLDLFELHNVEQTCQYFKDLAHIQYKKYKTLDVAEINKQQPITLMGIRNILRQIGNFITVLKCPAIRFSKPSSRVIELIPRYCKNIKHLSIDGFTMRNVTLQKFRHIFEHLETLELVHCVLVDKIEIFFALATKLKHLNLTSNYELTGKCLEKFHNLESLNLNNCFNIQPKYFSQFVKNNKALKYLNIGRCQRINQKNIEDMVANLTELEHLVISNLYTSVNSNGLAKLGELPKLKKIQIMKSGYSLLDSLFIQLANGNKLEHLEMVDGIVSNEVLKNLKHFTNLKYFKFTYKSDLTDRLLNSLVSKKELEKVYLTGCNNLTNDGLLDFIKNCPNLKCLDVSGCTKISQQFLNDANEYLLKNQPKHNEKIEIVCGLTDIYEETVMDHLKVILASTFEFQCSEDFDDMSSDYSDDIDYDYEYDSDNDYFNIYDDSSDCEEFFNYNFFY